MAKVMLVESARSSEACAAGAEPHRGGTWCTVSHSRCTGVARIWHNQCTHGFQREISVDRRYRLGFAKRREAQLRPCLLVLQEMEPPTGSTAAGPVPWGCLSGKEVGT